MHRVSKRLAVDAQNRWSFTASMGPANQMIAASRRTRHRLHTQVLLKKTTNFPRTFFITLSLDYGCSVFGLSGNV